MTLLYVLIAVLMILLVAFWAGRSQTNDTSRPEAGGDSLEGLLDGSGLSLAERLFDSGDYLWLRHEVGYPQLAQALLDWRKQMAIRWLKALRRSFDELVRTPEPVSPLENSEGAPSRSRSWSFPGSSPPRRRRRLSRRTAVLIRWPPPAAQSTASTA